MVNVRVWSLEHFARRLMRYQDERDDAVVVISGKTGTGKSTLAHHLCTTIAKEKGEEFDFESGMFYSKKRLLAAFEEFPERSVLFADEAVNIFFNRDFMNKWQKELVKKINMYRDKFFISFLLIPFFWQLDVALREGQRLKYWVFNDRRGVAYVFEADSQPFTRDPWNARLNSWLLRGWGRRGGRTRNDFVAARSPNFVAKLVYPPLSAEEEERYVRLKALGRRAAAAEELEMEESASKAKQAPWLGQMEAFLRDVGHARDEQRLFLEDHVRVPLTSLASLLGMEDWRLRDELRGRGAWIMPHPRRVDKDGNVLEW